MRIIEFMGCPGSGKSSVCKGIMDELTREGYNVANVHRDEIRKGGLSRKILSARSRLSPKMRSLGAELDKVMTYLPDKDSVWKRDVLNSSYKIGQKYVQGLDYAFFEEGPTQYITSILHDNAAGGYLRPLIDEVNRTFYVHDVTAFYITADPEEIVDRIRKRNRSGDRFLSDDRQNNLDYITKENGYRKLYVIENHDLDKAILQAMELVHKTEKE